MKDFLLGDTPEEVSELVLSTLTEFSVDLRNFFPMEEYEVRVIPLESWNDVKGERIIVLPYSELTKDGSLYFHRADLIDAMENPDLGKIKLILWEMLVLKAGYMLYKNYKQVKDLEFKNDIAILSSVLTSATLIGLDDVKTVTSVLDAKLEVIKNDLEAVESIIGIMELLNFQEQQQAYEEAKVKVTRAGAQFIDAAIINWIVLQSLSLAPIADPREEVRRLIRGSLLTGDLNKKVEDILNGIWAFYDILRLMGKEKTIELVEIRDKIMEFRKRLGLDYPPTAQDFSEKMSVG
ncbi:hypothetical protein Py04_0895 [Pyrococcus sp. ST04]|nr:hypothetical protein Py04_0895 [Pyrococcus sp. ST04]